MSKNKKAYYYKMNLVPANILAFGILIICFILTVVIDKNYRFDSNVLVLFITMMLYFCLHEFLHGVGYFLGGGHRDKIKYGICLEKGLLYCMDCEEISKKNILISLQMPFMVIGVITYIIGVVFNLNLLITLSIVNLTGAAMDLVMFFYILKLKDVIYSESGNNDEFVLISSENLEKKKSIFFKIIKVKDYKSEDFIFENIEKFTITKKSIIIFIIFLIIFALESLL